MPGDAIDRGTLIVAGGALVADALILALAPAVEPISFGGWPALLARGWGPGALLAHLLLTAAAGAILFRGSQRSARSPAATLLLALMATLGPPGTAIAFVSGLTVWLSPLAEPPAAPALEEGVRSLEATSPNPRATSADALDPEPLADVLRHGTLAQRREAVALIGSGFQPALAGALRLALDDEHNAIRVQAGMVMQQIEDAFDRRQAELEAHVDEELSRHGFGDHLAWLRLARLHDDHAFAGLLDPARTARAQAEALRAYRHHLRRRPDDLEVIAAVGRLLIRADQHVLVADWLDDQIGRGRVSPSILMWHAEALYGAGRFGALRAMAARHGQTLSSHLPKGSPLRAALTLWTDAPGTRAGRDGPEVEEPEATQTSAAGRRGETR